jgi:hypothetical protein
MPFFTATISHHSLSRAPLIEVTGSLLAAKRAATARFGDGFGEHEILIWRANGPGRDETLVAARRIDAKRWNNQPNA